MSLSDEGILRMARLAAKNSNCDKIKYGAVLLDHKGDPLSWGYNHNPYKTEGWSCKEHCLGGIRKGVESGRQVERCYAVHAEQHALHNLQQKYQGYEMAVAGWLPDGSLYDNSGGFYCTVCVRLMVLYGVQWISIWAEGERARAPIKEAWENSYFLLEVEDEEKRRNEECLKNYLL
jgi:deoxycytidylate deaminase